MKARATLAALAMVAGLAAFAVPPAVASEGIENFSVDVSTSQAGAHPDVRTKFSLDSPGVPESAQQIEMRMPRGVFGNPGAIERCTPAKFALSECSPGAQAGLVTVNARYEGDPDYTMGTSPIYNLSPRSSSETALLAFVVPIVDIPITVPVTVRTGTDYGLNLTVRGVSQKLPLAGVDMRIWGIPAEAEHNVERFQKGSPGNPPGCPVIPSAACIPSPYPEAGQAAFPFIDNPSVCSGEPMKVTLSVQTYQDPGNPSSKDAEYPATTGCEKQRFDPTFNAALTSNEADSASGLDLSLAADQFLGSPPSPSQMRSASVVLPEGLSINPDAADGQTSCSDAEAGFGTEAPSTCPDNSKIGTVDVHTPALEGPLTGSLYIGEPQPGNQYRIFMIFEGFGIYAKLAADFTPDPHTGRLTMSVDELPQVPFEEFNLHLFASDRGLIATPTGCSIYVAEANFVPWNDRLSPQPSRGQINVDSGPDGSGCPGQIRPFRPRLEAGTSNPVGGAFSSFALKLDRDDGDQFLGKLNFVMPPGLTGILKGVTYCPEAAIAAAADNLGRAEQAAPSCPASSQIGTSNVAAGPGGHPFHAVGRIYLSGPFKGAPFSLVAITPALAGPYDYGVVVVRVALNIDPSDAHVIADSEVVPSIIGGIPIRLRSIVVNIDKPDFMLNPTNCSPFSVDSEGIGDQGTAVGFSSFFQAVNCSTLPFKPRMTITQLGGHKATSRAQDPSMRFDLRTRPGDANIKSISVTLPKAFEIDQRHLGNICSRAQLAAERCAGRAAIGTVSTETPLLEAPLKGPAYAVSGFGKLPHLVFILAGQVTLIPEAESFSVKGGHLRAVVPVIPDAPIGHFRLTLFGGKRGYLINTRELCAAAAVTTVDYQGQNGKRMSRRVKAKTACAAKPKKKG